MKIWALAAASHQRTAPDAQAKQVRNFDCKKEEDSGKREADEGDGFMRRIDIIRVYGKSSKRFHGILDGPAPYRFDGAPRTRDVPPSRQQGLPGEVIHRLAPMLMVQPLTGV